jgi:hypothetical protein
MPMKVTEDFGTGPNGQRVKDYCRYCYANGAFTDPAITMQDMLQKCVAVMGGQGEMPAAQARTLMAEVLPHLKRWRTPVGTPQ